MGIRELTEGTGRLENSRNEVIGKGEQGVRAPEHEPWRGWLEPLYSTAIARGSWMPFAGHCWQHYQGDSFGDPLIPCVTSSRVKFWGIIQSTEVLSHAQAAAARVWGKQRSTFEFETSMVRGHFTNHQESHNGGFLNHRTTGRVFWWWEEKKKKMKRKARNKQGKYLYGRWGRWNGTSFNLDL